MTAAAPCTPPIDLGGCRIRVISGGALRLDGGAMFGIIPRALWSRHTSPDEQNRIVLACNCLYVEWDGSPRRAIVEVGHGPKFAEKECQIYAIDPQRWLLPALIAAGIDPESITDVVLTHLHFDHAGGLTHPATDPRPTFPRAAVHVQRSEFDDARANFGVMTQTYREENFAPIDHADLWRLHAGEAQPLPGVTVLPSPGHTRGHQSALIAGRNASLLFLGDVMPTRDHVGPAYNMGYDLFPLDNVATKKRVLGRAAAENWLLLIDHEPRTPLVRVVADSARFRIEPV
ncbi:MAG: putative quorum-quenching lactonase YtnP [Phycisphaerae bacterium]|nr:putative quorum-quenching lactonase YtnP [Phycisphaerae bacterium]